MPPDPAVSADAPADPGGAAEGRDSALVATRESLPAATRVRFRDGDTDALAEVYDRYARAVWAVAMTVTRADHLAQEATQEAFIRAWNAARSYDPERDLGPWLLTIARYTALDLLRREMRSTRGGHEAEQEGVVEAPGMDRIWLSWAVQEALRQLAEHEREIVRLSFYEDLSHAQIAERLSLPLGTVKSRSHRAHRRLAELLAHLREEPEATPVIARGRRRTDVGNPGGAGGRKHDGTEKLDGRESDEGRGSR
jgi:RNA polymerase sigma-70 factor (ECF subfamily)